MFKDLPEGKTHAYELKQCQYRCYPTMTNHIGEECVRCKNNSTHTCCDGECNHDDCCGKVSKNCHIKNSCDHFMVDTGKYERECKFCKLKELRAYGNKKPSI